MQPPWNKYFVWMAAFVLLGLVLLPGCRRDSGAAGLQAGLDALSRGEYEAAVTHLRAAAKRRPDSASAYCNLGIAYWKLGQMEPAISALTVASDLIGTDPTPLELLAQVYADMGQWGEARAVLKRLSDGMPDAPRILTWQATIEYRAGEDEAARALLEKTLDVNPNYSPALYNMAILHRDLPGGKAVAEEYFKRYLTVADNEAHAQQARDFLTAGEPPAEEPPAAAVEPPAPVAVELAPAVEPAPSGPAPPSPAPSPTKALLTQAADALKAEAIDKALVLLNRAVAADPDSADALWALAQLYDKQLNYAGKAENTYRLFTQRFPDDPRAARKRPVAGTPPATVVAVPGRRPAPAPVGGKLEEKRKTDKVAAQEAWQKALQAHAVKDYDEAVKQYRAALELDPVISNAAFNLGLVYRQQVKLDLAADAFEQALAAKPNTPKAHYMLAVIYRETNDKKKAIEQARKAVELQPDYGRAHLILGLLYRDTLQYDWAREHFRSAVVHAPDRETAKKARTWLDNTKGLKTDR